ncbi:uncharacterized protein LOC129090174 isoform X1 [Anoplopoma fimbria]|uniref:uncharacterized protein LOC129090174 isoform X1 n=1 Tax=Anoplopoma fimbria TaxID=229290 RepID=UPI0023EC5EBB|nr:uncharacterized protein LOC129090174 isoform X1 [Anoplopoma fimbria]
MILLCITLLLLHQGYADILVTTVELGEPATFTCVFTDSEYSNTRIKWYRQRIGDTLTLITTLMKGTAQPTFEQGFDPSQFYTNHSKTMSTLIILKTGPEDEALYHCAITTWSTDQWSGTYLSLKGNSLRTTYSTVVQWPSASDPVNLGDSVTLQCSVLSDSQIKSCPVENSVHWFGVRSDKSLPNIIYSGGNRHDGCEKITDTQTSCIYRFTKNISSSDAGTYYCAVATCGEILFGNGTKLDIEVSALNVWDLQKANVVLIFLLASLALSLIVIAFLIHTVKMKTCDCSNAAVALQRNAAAARGEPQSQQRNEDSLVYSAPNFTKRKTGRAERKHVKTAEGETIYTDVRTLVKD